MQKNLKASMQLTLDRLPAVPKKDPAATGQVQEKRIIIIEIDTLTKEDELALKVGFKLVPSKTAFSKVQSDLWFNNQKISSISIRIPQGPLTADDFEITPVLDMKGIPARVHIIKWKCTSCGLLVRDFHKPKKKWLWIMCLKPANPDLLKFQSSKVLQEQI
jgi:hypothetical protein